MTRLALLLCVALAAAPAITIRATPPIAMAPAGVIVDIRIAPHVDNRAVIVQCESADWFRSSGWTLDGDRARLRYSVRWPTLPPGDYVITAVVRGATTERGRAQVQLVRGGP